MDGSELEFNEDLVGPELEYDAGMVSSGLEFNQVAVGTEFEYDQGMIDSDLEYESGELSFATEIKKNDDSSFAQEIKRKRGKALKYNVVGNFNTSEEAKASLGSGWDLLRSSDQVKYFRCRHCKQYARIDEGCNMNTGLITYNAFSTTLNHSTHPSSSRGISIEVREIIRELFTSGVTRPKALMTYLEDMGHQVQTRKLHNFLSVLKKDISMNKDKTK